MNTIMSSDPHAQLRALYVSLLNSQERFDEFKQILALYHAAPDTCSEESSEAEAVRAKLNERIQHWIGAPIEGLSASQLLQWRSIVVEERVNVAISPWKESNVYLEVRFSKSN